MARQLCFEGLHLPVLREPGHDRLFFALRPEPAAAARLERLTRALRDGGDARGRPLLRAHYHLSLCHLGDFGGLPDGLVADAMAAAAGVASPAFDVTLDIVGTFRRRRIPMPLVLRSSAANEGLAGFRHTLSAALRHAGLPAAQSRRTFVPHLTIAYDDGLVAEQMVEAITWRARDFVLIHSLIGRTVHRTLGRWTLHDETCRSSAGCQRAIADPPIG